MLKIYSVNKKNVSPTSSFTSQLQAKIAGMKMVVLCRTAALLNGLLWLSFLFILTLGNGINREEKLTSQPTSETPQDDRQKFSSNYLRSQNLRNHKLLGIQRNPESFVHSQQSDHNLSSGQKQDPLDWQMLKAILSGFPDVEFPTKFNYVYPATEYPNINTSKAYQPTGHVQKSALNPYLKEPVSPTIDFVKKHQDFNNVSSWEAPDAPKVANQFGNPDGSLDVYVEQHILVSDGNESSSSPFGLGPTTSKPSKFIYKPRKPFWGIPISESSPHEFIFVDEIKPINITNNTRSAKQSPPKNETEELVSKTTFSKLDSRNNESNYNKSIMPFWGRPISESSPKHFKFRKINNNRINITTSSRNQEPPKSKSELFIRTAFKPDSSVKPSWGRLSADNVSPNNKFAKPFKLATTSKPAFVHQKADYESKFKPFWGRPIAELSPNHKSRPFFPTMAQSPKIKVVNKTAINNQPFWGLPISELSPKHFMNRKQEINSITTSQTPIEEEEEEEEEDQENEAEEEEEENAIASKIIPSVAQPPVTYPAAMQRVDFAPIFLALIPISLVVGAAASLSLASAVRPNQAIATAQQQQQQQQQTNDNNNNDNNVVDNNSALLSSLALVNSLSSGGSSGGGLHHYYYNYTTTTEDPNCKRKRKKRNKLH